MAAPVQIAQIAEPSATRFWLAIFGQSQLSWSVKSHAIRVRADRRAISDRRFDLRKGRFDRTARQRRVCGRMRRCAICLGHFDFGRFVRILIAPARDPNLRGNCPMSVHDSASLSPDQRVQGIAALLATGLRRLLIRSASPPHPKKLPELSPNCLEFSAETRLSGHAGQRSSSPEDWSTTWNKP